jgi:hypothetical protein
VNACKNANVDFFTLLKNNFGKVGYYIILSLFFVYFSVKGIIPISEQKDYVEMTLYTLTPTFVYFLPFFLVAFYFSTNALRVVGRASDIIWAITIIAFIILLSLLISSSLLYNYIFSLVYFLMCVNIVLW